MVKAAKFHEESPRQHATRAREVSITHIRHDCDAISICALRLGAGALDVGIVRTHDGSLGGSSGNPEAALEDCGTADDFRTRAASPTLRRAVRPQIHRVIPPARWLDSRAKAAEAGRNKPAVGESNRQASMQVTTERNTELASYQFLTRCGSSNRSDTYFVLKLQ